MSLPRSTFVPVFPMARAACRALAALVVLTEPSAPAQAATPRVAVGADFVVVSRSDGTVWAWGLGNDGQLGNGGTRRPAAVRCTSAG